MHTVLFPDGRIDYFYADGPFVYDIMGPWVNGTYGNYRNFTRDGPVTNYEHMCMLPAGSLLHVVYDNEVVN